MFQFEAAVKPRKKLRLALCGPAGSGKTFSALLIAKGLGGRVAMVDTEERSGLLYARNPRLGLNYHHAEFRPPFSPSRAVEAIEAAARAGFDVVVFDSLSHVWMGEGGLLDMVDLQAKRVKDNTFAAWKAVRPHEKKFLEAILRTDIHIIATMRTKAAWEIQKDEKSGKSKPVKIGLKPEHREGLEYEFDVVIDLTTDGHVASASKDRSDLFGDDPFIVTDEVGRRLGEWLQDGEARTEAPKAAPAPTQAPAAQAAPSGDSPSAAELAANVWAMAMDLASGEEQLAIEHLSTWSKWDRGEQVYTMTSLDDLTAKAKTHPRWVQTTYGRAKTGYRQATGQDWHRGQDAQGSLLGEAA